MKVKHPIALVGTGNFALNVEALLSHFGTNLTFCVDEFRTEDFLRVPVIRAGALTHDNIASVKKFVIAISHPEHCTAAIGRLQRQGVPAGRIIAISDDPSIQILRLLFEKFGEPAVAAFCSEGCLTVSELEARFLSNNWQQVFSVLDPARLTFGLCYYGRGGGFRRHLAPLIPHLEQRFNLVTVSDELIGGDGEIPGRHFFMSSESACRHSFFDLVLSAHIFPCSPPEVPRITFSHVIYDFNLSPDYHAERISKSDTHYLFASSRPCLDWYVRLIRDKGLNNRLCVIPGGYLHLDENIALAESYRGKIDSIIYAPTLSLADYPHCDLATSIFDGDEIVEHLLARFPDYRIIFRPHPSDLKLFQMNRRDARSEPFARLLKLCEGHPQCILDNHPTRYMESYNRSAAMISDTSSTAMTFAFATGRPVFFYAPRNEELSATLGGQMAFVRDRAEVGEISTSIDNLLRQMERHLLNGNTGHESVRNFRNRVIFNVGTAGNYLAENIDFILYGEKHADWHYFNW